MLAYVTSGLILLGLAVFGVSFAARDQKTADLLWLIAGVTLFVAAVAGDIGLWIGA